MTFGWVADIGAAVSVANLATLGVLLWRGAKWTERVESEARALRAANDADHADIKAVLGNGAPGTVVRIPVCMALHQGVADRIDELRVDVRDLRGVVERNK